MALRLRIPAWLGPSTTVRVNGTIASRPAPGRFAAIARTWRTGDRVDLLIDTPLRAEPVDAHYTDHVAVMRGPLALFACGDHLAPVTRSQLASLRQVAFGRSEWFLMAGTGRQSYRPFIAIGSEATRLYQRVIGEA